MNLTFTEHVRRLRTLKRATRQVTSPHISAKFRIAPFVLESQYAAQVPAMRSS